MSHARAVRPLLTALAAAIAIALVAAVAAAPRLRGADSASALPPEECVRMLREARLAGGRGDAAAELERLRAAIEAFPREVSALYALIEYGRRHPLAAEERRTVLARLGEHLADPARPLAAGVVQRIAADPYADDESLNLIADGVTRRLAGTEVAAAPPWLAVLAQLQTRLGRLDAATATLERLWATAPGDDVAWPLFTLYGKLDRPRDAAALIDASATLRDAVPRAHVRLLIEAGRHDDAVRRTGEILGDLDPENPMIPAFLADVAWHLRDAGRDAEAEAMFRRVLASAPDHAGARDALLHLYADPEERAEHAAAAARRWRQEDDPQAVLDEGTQRLAAGDAEGALELLEWAAPRFPRLEPAWFNLGMAAYRVERWPTVVEAFGRAAELNPERAASFFFRGIALVHLERCAEAVAILERSLELDPERYQSHYHLAGCYRQLGDTAAADRHRAKYDATRPD